MFFWFFLVFHLKDLLSSCVSRARGKLMPISPWKTPPKILTKQLSIIMDIWVYYMMKMWWSLDATETQYSHVYCLLTLRVLDWAFRWLFTPTTVNLYNANLKKKILNGKMKKNENKEEIWAFRDLTTVVLSCHLCPSMCFLFLDSKALSFDGLLFWFSFSP